MKAYDDKAQHEIANALHGNDATFIEVEIVEQRTTH